MMAFTAGVLLARTADKQSSRWIGSFLLGAAGIGLGISNIVGITEFEPGLAQDASLLLVAAETPSGVALVRAALAERARRPKVHFQLPESTTPR